MALRQPHMHGAMLAALYGWRKEETKNMALVFPREGHARLDETFAAHIYATRKALSAYPKVIKEFDRAFSVKLAEMASLREYEQPQ